METREVKAKKILNPTSIDLGEYVINPYRGCAFSCLYCYVKHNKVTKNDSRQWGSYVDIRINAPELLEKELRIKKPRRVLLGSTTECFQPLEIQYKITGQVLDILNRHKVFYSILTRSPLILNSLPLLKKGFCESIYFTVNDFPDTLKQTLEPRSAPFRARSEAVDALLNEGLPVIPYISPVFPYLSDMRALFGRFQNAKTIDLEGLNFNLGSIDAVIEAVGSIDHRLKELYFRMANDGPIYDRVWQSIKKEIVREAIKTKKNHHLFVHGLRSYFKNKYKA